jgi:CubicO group peptidase (beta-lactamase class C family)
MESLQAAVDHVAERIRFSGVVRVDRSGEIDLSRAYGLADRAHEIPNTVDTMFAIASGSKPLTALVVMALVERGLLDLTTTARSVLGGDLPLVADDATIEHLMAHRSGIGDYLDESTGGDITDHVLSVPVHELVTAERFLPVLSGHESVFAPGDRFAYNNAGYVVLALVAERVSGEVFHDLVHTLVCEPAGLVDTTFLRSDELPGRAALGYLWADRPRTNVFHLPVLGSGDGGAYSTVADLTAFWESLFAGRIVSPELVAAMLRPRSDWPEESRRYGLGFHLHTTKDAVWLEGYDAGVSFTSLYQPSSAIGYTVISNWSDGAWPMVGMLNERLGI